MSTPSAPALRRGVEVLRLLGDHGPLTLDAIARHTAFPKSSLLRILETLADLQLVLREADQRLYRATARLVPLPAGNRVFEEAIARMLDTLAASTAQTAEWYVPGPDGMVMVRRAEPPRSEVRVIARIGFLRPWRGELDAIARLGLAFFHPPPRGGAWWTYDANRNRTTVARREVHARVAQARQDAYALDELCNPNGVRRIAALVAPGGKPRGVLALAESLRPGPPPPQDAYLQQLLNLTTELTRQP